MKVVCPKCELKGQVDAVPKGARTRIACVRCATTFDAVLVDGEIQALPPQGNYAEAQPSSVASEVHTVADVSGVESFDAVSELPDENQFDASRQVEASAILVDESLNSSTDSTLETPVDTIHATPQEISQELWPQSIETRAEEATCAVEVDAFATTQTLKSLGTGKVNRPPTDAYGMGVRLMRVSPLWLLLAGLSFISFIVFCNWLIKPTEPAEDTTRLVASASNGATNQAKPRVALPASNAQSSANNQVPQPSNEASAEFVKTEAKAPTQPTPAPSVEQVAAKPALEEKRTPEMPSSNRAVEAKDGKITIQVGSYNAATEADERVASLKSAGFEARSVAVEIPKRGTWYRVQSGRFSSRDEAERYGKQLRDKGVVSSFITTDVQE
ncbi:MAG TPA: SPOR domain-containing protein [Pyrinomonadaceae bacterium]|nr:SPOR domain-containing protein [Pyrinomonadaceae bacterium]